MSNEKSAQIPNGSRWFSTRNNRKVTVECARLSDVEFRYDRAMESIVMDRAKFLKSFRIT